MFVTLGARARCNPAFKIIPPVLPCIESHDLRSHRGSISHSTRSRFAVRQRRLDRRHECRWLALRRLLRVRGLLDRRFARRRFFLGQHSPIYCGAMFQPTVATSMAEGQQPRAGGPRIACSATLDARDHDRCRRRSHHHRSLLRGHDAARRDRPSREARAGAHGRAGRTTCPGSGPGCVPRRVLSIPARRARALTCGASPTASRAPSLTSRSVQ